MYSDVYPKSFLKSSPEENAGLRLRPAPGYTSLIFPEGGPEGALLGALKRDPYKGGSRVTIDDVGYNKK